MAEVNEMYKFYCENQDFKTYIDKCVKTYGKDVNYMLSMPISREYYKQLKVRESEKNGV